MRLAMFARVAALMMLQVMSVADAVPTMPPGTAVGDAALTTPLAMSAAGGVLTMPLAMIAAVGVDVVVDVAEMIHRLITEPLGRKITPAGCSTSPGLFSY